jgi:hypothetical protein
VYTTTTLSFLLPAYRCVNAVQSSRLRDQAFAFRASRFLRLKRNKKLTLNTVRLGQLRAVRQEILVDSLPVLAFGQPHVDMRRGEVIGVEPEVFIPAVLDELLVCE